MFTFEDKQAQSETLMLEGVLNGAQVLTTSEPRLQTVSSVTDIKDIETETTGIANIMRSVTRAVVCQRRTSELSIA